MKSIKITPGAGWRGMRPRAAVCFLSCFALTFCPVLVQAQSATSAATGQQPVKKAAPAPSSPAAAAQDPGERKFQANCGRCHSAPEQLSPRIAGTVLRHMRVRATLSAETERDILRYLAP
jgi:cytochrome c5